MRGQPQRGLRRFIEMTASMSSVSAPLGQAVVALGRKQNSVLSFAQQAVKMPKGGRLQSNSGTEETCRLNEKRAQSHDDPIGVRRLGARVRPRLRTSA